jgi:hypothetical protein
MHSLALPGPPRVSGTMQSITPEALWVLVVETALVTAAECGPVGVSVAALMTMAITSNSSR